MKPKKSHKHQGVKLAAIPVLLCILAYVLLAPTAGPVAESDPLQAQINPQQPSTPSIPPKAAGTPENQHWPEVDLAFMSLANPFASPPNHLSDSATEQHEFKRSPPPNEDELNTVAREVATQPIDYVFQSKKRKLVMLGGQVFEQGAQLSEEVTLHDIQNHALILTRNQDAQASETSRIDY